MATAKPALASQNYKKMTNNIEIKKYNPEFEKLWDEFVANSKNATFLLNRGYMDYHSDRFIDNSLMFFEEQNLVAVLPANLKNNILYSHQGLTFGGFISNSKMRTPLMLSLFEALTNYCKSNQITQLIYKPIPQFYSEIPAQEDLYALFKNGAQMFRCDVSSVINLQEKVQFSELRRRMIKKALKENLQVHETKDFGAFHDILQENLSSKHETSAVHNLEEIKKLSEKFPENIKLFASFKDEKMLAAVWVFINRKTVHLQYISSLEEGRRIGALDLVMDHLINKEFTALNYFDFGISTEDGGKFLNEGLIGQKEMFGGRAYCYNQYSIKFDDEK